MSALGERVAEAPALGRASARFHRFATAARRVLVRNPNMLGGLIIILAMICISVLAPLITSVGPAELNARERYVTPSPGHWFGTDQLGRDVYSRTVYGGRVSLVVGGSVAAVVAITGAILGLAAGYYRRVDDVLMRFMDGLMAFPSLLLALALIALLGASMENIIIVICVVDTPRMVRVVRGSALSVREQDFVTAAVALGAGSRRIMVIHMFPNVLAPMIIQATFVFATAILTEASLSFLGAGIEATIPTWGNIMGAGRTYLQRAVWVTFFPGLFLSLTVLAINLVGDGLRDALDPRLRRRA